MIKLAIADDDNLALEYLKNVVDWSQFNISVEGAFSSGQNLIDHLRNNEVDIVISDIKMSPPNGLEIAKLCHEEYPNTHVILVSAFRDFDYAKTALSYGVKKYILKPYSAEDIIEVLNEIIPIIKNKANNKTSINSFMKNIVYQKLFSNICCGIYSSFEEISNALLENEIRDSKGAVLEFRISDFNNYITNTWKYGMVGLSNALSTIAYTENENVLFFLCTQNQDRFNIITLNANQTDIDTYTKGLIEQTKNILSIGLEALSVTPFNSTKELPNMFGSYVISFDKRINQINAYLNDNYMNNLSLDSIAKHFYFSKEYFCALYKKISGKTLTDALQEIRLNKACELLTNSNMNIAQIINAVGYKNQSYFTRLFKSHYSLTPTEYREIYRTKSN